MISCFQAAIKLIPSDKRRGMYLLFLTGTVLSLVDAMILMCVPALFTLKTGVMVVMGFKMGIWVPLVFLGSVLVLKNMLIIYFQYAKNLYLSSLHTYFSRQILASNLLSEKARGKDIGGNISNLVVEPLQLILNVYGPFINLVVEGSVGFFIFAALLWLNPVGSTLLGVIMVPIILGYHYMVRIKNQRWGEYRSASDAIRSEWGRSALSGAEEIAIMGKTDFILDKFSNVTEVSTRMVANKSTTIDIAKNVIELSVLFSVSVVVVFSFVVLEYTTSQLLVMLATFSFSAYRLMPSLNRIMVSLQSIRYGYGPLRNIAPDLAFQPDDHIDGATTEAFTLEFKCHRMKVGDHYIQDVSCALRRGDVLLIKGESGVGKSTLVRALLYGSPSLNVFVNDQKLSDGLYPSRVSVAYMNQTSSVLPVTLVENIAMSEKPLKPETIAYIDELKVAALQDKDMLRHEQLSGGQRSRIALLRGIEHNASVFFLDEPSSALDSSTKTRVAAVIKKLTENAIIVIISHDNDFDKIATQVLEIHKNE